MKSSVSIVISLLIGLIANVLALASNETAYGLSNKNQTSQDVFHPILLECENSDYRTYIQCLKRHKRQHEHHDSSGRFQSCYDDCELDLCSSNHCIHQCYSKCMKKTKQTFITEFETPRSDEDMKKSPASAPNITTNIDINNVIHNHVKTETPSTTTIRPAPPSLPSTPPPPSLKSSCTTYGCFPPIQVVSQITFGAGPIGGCLNAQSWPCIQQPQPTSFDCSLCVNPWYRYQCEAKCCNIPIPGAEGSNPFSCSGRI